MTARRGTLRVALAQMSSTRDVSENLRWIGASVAAAAARGCDLIVLPENAPLLAPEADRLAQVEPLDGRQITSLRDEAHRHRIALVVGSFAESGPDPGRSFNTCVVIDADGEIAGVYRKIHLFDVSVAADTTFRESDTVAAGPPEPVCVDVLGWRLGLSICYDLRFPELYRRLVADGAEVLLVPAAFTLRTGAAHWHALLRARAIENLCWVLAPGQTGRHYGARESYGHSLAVSPWGDVRLDAGDAPGLHVVDIDRAEMELARARIPALAHRRLTSAC